MRIATHKDHEAILELVKDIAYANPTYPRVLSDSREQDVQIWWNSMQAQNPVTIVRGNNGNIEGLVNILIPPRNMLASRIDTIGMKVDEYAEVAGMCIAPNLQNQGLGTLLFTSATQYVHELDKRIVLMVRPTAPSALHVYKKNGLQEVSSFVDHSDMIYIMAE